MQKRGYVRRLSPERDGVLRPLRAYLVMLTCQPVRCQRVNDSRRMEIADILLTPFR